MILVDRDITIKANNTVKKHYIAKGYIVGGNNSPLVVKVGDLPERSRIDVPAECDYCGVEYKASLQNLVRGRKIVPKDCCADPKCKSQKVREVTNKKYGVNNVMELPEFAEKISGRNNYNYDFSKTDEERAKKRDEHLREDWRRQVFSRDSYICQICGVAPSNGKHVYLEAHHLEAYNISIELRHEVDNGVTLCVLCHRNFHKVWGYGDNTETQFTEYRKAKGKSKEELHRIVTQYKHRAKNKKLSKQCYCIELATTFESLSQASLVLTGEKDGGGNIRRAINNKSKTYGYTWRGATKEDSYNEEAILKLLATLVPLSKELHIRPCYCIELDKEFPSLSEASEFLGLKRSDGQIAKAINNRWKCHGYTWK